ncbi:MAG: molybdopterin-guanine dinucleotide biosynthesis protein B [Desulfobulbaceae bacterium DB1]|nr:MAG: molybdopterin-guanine dinucleotide biosynthesis protein B [Desulfobulbaceae bacterium DB1]
MPKIVTFIGWHDSGKTTLATQVISHLKEAGYRVAVIKSSKETGVSFDAPGTDTGKHRQAGADSVLFVAPDQMVLMTANSNLALTTLAHRYFADADIVIGEGFKQADRVAKIEVARNHDQLLRDTVTGVIAVVTDQDIAGDSVFRPHQSREIAAFIEKRFLRNGRNGAEEVSLLVNGSRIPLKNFVQRSLAGTVAGFVKSLKLTENAREIEIRIKLNDSDGDNCPQR